MQDHQKSTMAERGEREDRRGPTSGRARRIALGAAVIAAATAAGTLLLTARGRDPVSVPVAAAAVKPAVSRPDLTRPLRILLHEASGRPWITLPISAGGTATDPQTGKRFARLPAGDLMVSADNEN